MEQQQPAATQITQLLKAVGQGDAAARERLWAVLYQEIHRMARLLVAAEHGQTHQPTSLVHEAFLRLAPDGEMNFANRRHFFVAAAQAMRRALIDDARRRMRLKRGGAGNAPPTDAEPNRADGHPPPDPLPGKAREQADGHPHPGPLPGRERELRAKGRRVDIEEIACFDQDPVEVLAINEALTKLEKYAPRMAEVVMLRYICGWSVDETAALLGVSPRTVDSDWRCARAWLHRELSPAVD